ncbi:coenzyme Q-binding protein ZGC, mitochondrial [Acrasis kona]|uniref:Coenzyme Q-binding protein ZGC, mitochondrial n=1 Tax=Acrasis kona TaxID=1008807 RepID=A0AAW2YJR1_9EUKA
MLGVCRHSLCSIRSGSLQRRGFLNMFGNVQKTHKGIHYVEQVEIGYTPKQVFDVVSNVDEYKQFLKHVRDSKQYNYKAITQKNDNLGNMQPTAYMNADLEVGFPPFIEKYTSSIILRDPDYVRVEAEPSRLFTHLENIWEMKEGSVAKSCILTFYVNFGFSNELYQKVANTFFNLLVKTMTDSFEKRCNSKYGKPSVTTRIIKSETTYH